MNMPVRGYMAILIDFNTAFPRRVFFRPPEGGTTKEARVYTPNRIA